MTPLLVFALLFAAPVQAAKPKRPIISRITLRTSDIFNTKTNPYLNRFPYSWINALHIETKEDIIRRELLFKVGDHLDPFLIKETERNLRALSFIRTARIAQFPQRDGMVALVVFSADSWTTEPQINLGGQNAVDTVEFGFKEKNFLGYGKTVEAFYKSEPDNIERSYKYFDPRLLGSRWQLSAEYINFSKGKETNFMTERPYFSADTRWGSRLSHVERTEVLDQFENHVKVSEFEQTATTDEAYLGTKLGGGRELVARSGLRFKMDRKEYEAIEKTTASQAIPAKNDFQTFFLDTEILRNRYVELTRVEKMTRVEDINLGPKLNISPGYSPRRLTGKSDVSHLEATYDHRFLFDRTNLLETHFAMSGREVFSVPQNERFKIYGKFFYREQSWQTLVVHSRMEWGYYLDADNNITLGSDNGLRAYKKDEFVGNKSWVFNLEDRFYFWSDVLELFSVGAVAFYDAGTAWPQGKPVAISDICSSIGAGFRLAITKSSNEPILRFDVAYRMQHSPSDTDRWVFSFGSKQTF
ncbi:MAG: BamA/TamA family outer membrane protein [Elusimicrobia bacterium]|nr:BamA/TamA family outer membrane protein [Candidatus Obscuribacterium magneticum]